MTSSAELEARAKMARPEETQAPGTRLMVFPTVNGGDLILDPAEVVAINSSPVHAAVGDPAETWPTVITLKSGTQFVVDVPLVRVRKAMVNFWGALWPSDQA